MITIEKKIISHTFDFYEKVIENFCKGKKCKMEFIYNEY